jgi:predicted nucleic acid-binding protein
MIAVADTGRLNYLVLIGHVDVLSLLFSRVVIPRAVAVRTRLRQGAGSVRKWGVTLRTGWISDPIRRKTGP